MRRDDDEGEGKAFSIEQRRKVLVVRICIDKFAKR